MPRPNCLSLEVEVVRGAEPRHKGQFLVNDGDPFLPGGSGVLNERFPAIDDNGAGIGLVSPAQDLQERRLPRSVFSDQRVDLSSMNVEGDVIESLNTGEGLADVIQLKMGAGVQFCRPFPG
jgi:hypothetical protein